MVLRSVAEDPPIDDALAYAEELRSIDVMASVFRSGDFPSLNAGYWVVYACEYPNADSAQQACRELTERGLDCYHRFVGDA